MKTGFKRVSLLDDNERIKNGRYQLTFRFYKNNELNRFSATTIRDIMDIADNEDILWIVTDEDAAKDLIALEDNLMLIDDKYDALMNDLKEKERQIVLDKQKLRNTRRQERSVLLKEYQKKYKGYNL